MNELLTEKGYDPTPAEYVANVPNNPNKCALNPNHTHFILVDTPTEGWGQEIQFRSNFESYIRAKFQIPVVLIVVNGGPGTLDTVAQAAEKNFAIVVVQGSGRASDAVASLVKKAQNADSDFIQNTSSLMDIHDDGVDISAWSNLLKEAKGDQKKIATWTAFMDRILANYQAVTVFNADDEASADMDIFILRAILSSPGKKLSLQEKLTLGVVWNRDDIVAETLETEKDSGLSSAEKRQALNAAFELAIQLDRPTIFSILAENGAQKDSVDLQKLYYYKPIRPFFKRLPAYAQTRHRGSSADMRTGLPLPTESSVGNLLSEYSRDTKRNRIFLKEVFRQAGNTFEGYFSAFEIKFVATSSLDEARSGTLRRNKKKVVVNESSLKVSFTDILIWAVFVNRMDLAKVVWQNTTLPVHSALLACQLYRYLSHHCANKEEYLENATWFESEAIKLMDIFAYSDIKQVLGWKWAEMGHRTALDIAQDSQCKKFICHSHVQSWLDDNFYSDQYGKVEPTIATFRIWLSIVMPLFIYTIYKPNELSPKQSILYFYRLPIVKFWTNTFFYCGFLFVQAWVLCNLDQRDKYYPAEIILWIWVFSLVVDEFHQYIKDRANHFKYLSNLMDVGILLLHIVYMVLRWVSHEMDQDSEHVHPIFLAAINILIIATLFSWGRLLNAFAISDSLGPLYFIIIRLFKDIFVWIFVFVIFAVSFQLGFVSITKQAGADPLKAYPDGTFPVSFFTIIGDFSYAAPILEGTPLGVALLAVYALLAQILLVNLLIAMMGDTYSNVSDNSAEEWKFYRLELMMENQSTSFHPPPTNLIIVPIEIMLGRWERKVKKWEGSTELEPLVQGQELSPIKHTKKTAFDLTKTLKKMRIARDEVIDAEHEAEETSVENIVTNVQERLRTLANERENDRTFLNKKFKDLETTLTKAANEAIVSGRGGPVAGLALDKLQETIHDLQESNTLLTQQNQRVLSVLEQLSAQQAQMNQQMQAQQQQIALLQQQRQERARLTTSRERVLSTSGVRGEEGGAGILGGGVGDGEGVQEGEASGSAILPGGNLN
eukprot:Phypoly_transcript_01139.p1 GENE.Phypoly_transcript_01139~~Phypoly_transcript_01139.p1  ORF type:complete len:1209 (+),score=210.24 Phypoly_transcript_01139:454-3627(+)